MARTTTEKRMSIEEQIKQLETERKQLLQKEKSEKQKADNQRYCKRGVVIEKLLPHLAALSDEQFNVFLNKVLATEQTKRIIDGISTSKSAPPKQRITEPEPTVIETDNEEDSDDEQQE